jgi:hypothetical protein
MSFEKEYYEAERFWLKGVLENRENTLRIIETTNLIPDDVNTLADIGCGNGVFGNYLLKAKPNLDVLCVDRSETALKYVNTKKLLGDILSIPLEENSYDLVSCLQVLEHIPSAFYEKSLSELARISKKYILIGVPFKEDIRMNDTICPSCGSKFNADLHLRRYSETDIQNLFINNGFKMVNMVNVVKGEQLIGLGLYLKLKSLFEQKVDVFKSPNCPICGFKNEKDSFNTKVILNSNYPEISNLSSNNYSIKNSILKFWPKKILEGYWAIAIYQKIS